MSASSVSPAPGSHLQGMQVVTTPTSTVLFNIHDCIVLALDIADNQCPFPEEACDLLREALADMRALFEDMGL